MEELPMNIDDPKEKLIRPLQADDVNDGENVKAKKAKKAYKRLHTDRDGLLMGSGDALCQIVIERKSWKEYRWQRTVRFFSLGTFFVGPTLSTWYGALHRTIGSGKGLVAFKKVAVDQGLFAPVFIVIFLTVLGAVEGSSLKETQESIKRNYKDIMIANWSVWPAVQICNFSFVPVHHQVLVAQTFALLWNTYLAWKTNQEPSPSPEKILEN